MVPSLSVAPFNLRYVRRLITVEPIAHAPFRRAIITTPVNLSAVNKHSAVAILLLCNDTKRYPAKLHRHRTV
jgi:hypothetical protein